MEGLGRALRLGGYDLKRIGRMICQSAKSLMLASLPVHGGSTVIVFRQSIRRDRYRIDTGIKSFFVVFFNFLVTGLKRGFVGVSRGR